MSRAVQYEVADSLSQDSCMSTISRFEARRGVLEIMMKKIVVNLFDEMFVWKEFASQDMQGRLNTPSAPHSGDVWERHKDPVWTLDDNCPQGVWSLGIVEKTHTGPDGVVRLCLLKTALGKVTRQAVRLGG